MASERKRAQWAAKNRLRRQKVLDAALTLAEADGYSHITRAAVADMAGLSRASVSLTFAGMGGLRREVMSAAVSRGLVKIIAQGLAAGDPIALAAPHSLKQQAAEALL